MQLRLQGTDTALARIFLTQDSQGSNLESGPGKQENKFSYMYHSSCTSESKIEVISSLLLCGYVLSAQKTPKVLRSCSSSCNIFVLLPGARPSSTKTWHLQICAAYCERLSVNSINFYGFFSQNHFVAPPLSAGTLGRNPPTTNLTNRETSIQIVDMDRSPLTCTGLRGVGPEAWRTK